jgi:hypothetical protein
LCAIVDGISHISVFLMLFFLVIPAVVAVDLLSLLKLGGAAITMTMMTRGRYKCSMKGLDFMHQVISLATIPPRLYFSCLPTPFTLMEPRCKPLRPHLYPLSPLC